MQDTNLLCSNATVNDEDNDANDECIALKSILALIHDIWLQVSRAYKVEKSMIWFECKVSLGP